MVIMLYLYFFCLLITILDLKLNKYILLDIYRKII